MSLQTLPTEMQLQILDFLSVPELLRLSKTCRCLQNVARGPSLWKNYTHIDVGELHELENDDFIQLISKCPNLKHANFEDTLIEDSALERLASDCPDIDELNLFNCQAITLYSIQFYIASKKPPIQNWRSWTLEIVILMVPTHGTLERWSNFAHMSTYCTRSSPDSLIVILQLC